MQSWTVFIEERRIVAVNLIAQDRDSAIKRVEPLGRHDIEQMRGFRIMATERKYDAAPSPTSLS